MRKQCLIVSWATRRNAPQWRRWPGTVLLWSSLVRFQRQATESVNCISSQSSFPSGMQKNTSIPKCLFSYEKLPSIQKSTKQYKTNNTKQNQSFETYQELTKNVRIHRQSNQKCFVLVMVSTVVYQHHDQKKPGERGVYFSSRLQSII